MTSQELRKLRARFEQLLEATETERSAILHGLRQSDSSMAHELERMLAAHDTPGSVLDQPLAEEIGLRAASSTGVREGSEIGPYSIKKELGLGGMGVVYLATRTYGNFERRVAIKILRHDRIDRLFLGRFQQERQILAQLTHPHIASILDAGETADGDPYFVMEYVDGDPITTHCERRALGIDAKLDLFLQICDAVQYAHRNLTVHRDLKPGNVLVTEAGAVKLLDFGIARLIEQTQEPSPDAPPTAAILTPEYSSPEQIRREPITTATDVFALGILLYELLSGSHPFARNGRLPHEVMRAICEDDPVPPSAAVVGRDAKLVRGDLDTIALTAMRRQPLWRYPSVEQLAEDVRRYRRGWPILAKGNRRWYRTRKFARRHWRPLAAAVLLVVSLAAGILATSYQASRASHALAVAEKERASAEAERADSDRQRALAERAQQTAVEQRRVAEARTLEAEKARQQERQRYRDVRALASSLLFDLYDGVRDLAGSTTARRLIVSKAQHQLEMLTADGDDDIGLKRDLAASYERMGELRVDPHAHNKNDAAAALDDYGKALQLRRKIAAAPQASPMDRRDLALSLSKLGDGQFFAGDSKDAIASYDSAWEIARALVQSAPDDPSMRRALGAIDGRRCTTLMGGGKTADALDACQEGISTLSPLSEKSETDMQVEHTVAATEASWANALRLSQKPQEAVKHATLALASLKRLQALAPNNAEYRRLSSTAETILANCLAADGRAAESIAAYRRAAQSMQIAMEIDPGDLGSALRLAVTLRSLARRLSAGGDKDSAHETARQALQLLEQTAQQPGAGAVEWNEYADALVKVEWPDLRQPARALQLARDAVAATNRKNPFILDTLAWACYRAGDPTQAVETEREALALLPPKATGGLSLELNQALKTFSAPALPAPPAN